MQNHSVVIEVLSITLITVVAVDSDRAAAAPAAEQSQVVREIEIVVDGGYTPGRISIGEGERVRLKFIRRDHTPCTREVVFAGLDIRLELPTDQLVTIEMPALTAGEYPFTCGMKMIRGTLIVQPRTP